MKSIHIKNVSPKLYSVLQIRHGGIIMFSGIFLGLSFIIRIVLLAESAHDITWDLSLMAAFGWGLLYDIGAACWFSLALIVILSLLPDRFFERHWGRLATHVMFFVVFYALRIRLFR